MNDDTFEKIELAEHMLELGVKGCSVTLRPLNGDYFIELDRNGVPLCSYDGNMLKGFRYCVDHLRRLEKSATLEEEREAMQVTADKHNNIPLAFNQCTCGSHKKLQLDVTVVFEKCWLDGQVSPVWEIPQIFSKYGKCPDCKQTYRFK